MSDKHDPEVAALEAWMTGQGMSLPDLARELGMSYDGVYQSLRWRGRVSTGMQLRLIRRYGEAQAHAILNGSAAAQVQA